MINLKEPSVLQFKTPQPQRVHYHGNGAETHGRSRYHWRQ